MMTQYNNPFLRQNGLQQGQIGAATTGQYARPAGTVTPPVTQQEAAPDFSRCRRPAWPHSRAAG